MDDKDIDKQWEVVHKQQPLPSPLPTPFATPVPSAPTTEAFYPAINPGFAPQWMANQAPNFVTANPSDSGMMQLSAPVPPQHVVSVAPFAIGEQQAKDIFKNWRDERWFAPSDFQNLKEGQLFAFLVPYYEFTATTDTKMSGKVGFYQTTYSTTYNPAQGHIHVDDGRVVAYTTTPQQQQTTTRTVHWRPAHGQFTSTFPSILICASIVDEDVKLLHGIGTWDTTKVQISPSYQNQIGPSRDWATCWKRAQNRIEEENRSRARKQLQKENGADEVDNVSTTVFVSSLQYRLVYFPVYYYGYSYEKKEYKFFINGQNGMRTGERPYGLGMLGRGIDAIGSYVTGLIGSITSTPTANKQTVDEWKKLQQPQEKHVNQ